LDQKDHEEALDYQVCLEPQENKDQKDFLVKEVLLDQPEPQETLETEV